jgi:sugar phosphate isomerase/epimerase
MSDTQTISFSVFTKPWKEPLAELAPRLRALGFDGIELPVRPGFQVFPERVATDLPAAARLLADHGLRIFSIAGTPDEPTIAACAEAGVPIIRIMVDLEPREVLAQLEAAQRGWDALLPALDSHGVTIGIQNHSDNCVANAMGLLRLVEKYDARHVAAVWDAAHNALEGEQPEIALDLLWSHLCMVNLKNAVRAPAGVGERGEALWRTSWCAGKDGFASWPRVADELMRRNYRGVVCLTAEYDDTERVEELASADLEFAKSVFLSQGA